jgi:hypothetical protein
MRAPTDPKHPFNSEPYHVERKRVSQLLLDVLTSEIGDRSCLMGALESHANTPHGGPPTRDQHNQMKAALDHLSIDLACSIVKFDAKDYPRIRREVDAVRWLLVMTEGWVQ